MDINSISQLISTIGFPIAACCALFYLYTNTMKELTVAIAKIDATMEHILNHLEGVRVYKHTEQENAG